MRLRARWVLPISGPPIADGEVVVEEGRIAEVRPSRGLPAPDARDFGEAALLPGLVNVHSHLDYTVFRGLLDDLAFYPWVRTLNARRAALEERDWLASASLGALEAARAGVTTLGDCTATGASLLACRQAGLRAVVYQEVFGIDEEATVDAALADLDARVAGLRRQARGARIRVGVSPHAPYTVRPALLGAVAAWARERGLPTCIHAAESPEEARWVRDGSGPFGEMCARRGIRWEPTGSGVVAHLDRAGALDDRTLLVHGVQVSTDDARVARERGAAWAHCPKSNAKLANGIAPLGLLRGRANGPTARIGLGSDSVASNNTMDLFEEMRFAVLAHRAIRRRADALDAPTALRMATLGGARALGWADRIGSLEVGKEADVVAVRLDAATVFPVHDPVSSLVYAASSRDVAFAAVAGVPTYEEGKGTRQDPAAVLARAAEAAAKLRAWGA
ncbi:MAG: amidohydrolase family protein [Chthonomonadales bacterium]|nr:amidohydrolase family protein [Chthonomonadales bacterium]